MKNIKNLFLIAVISFQKNIKDTKTFPGDQKFPYN